MAVPGAGVGVGGVGVADGFTGRGVFVGGGSARIRPAVGALVGVSVSVVEGVTAWGVAGAAAVVVGVGEVGVASIVEAGTTAGSIGADSVDAGVGVVSLTAHAIPNPNASPNIPAMMTAMNNLPGIGRPRSTDHMMRHSTKGAEIRRLATNRSATAADRLPLVVAGHTIAVSSGGRG